MFMYMNDNNDYRSNSKLWEICFALKEILHFSSQLSLEQLIFKATKHLLILLMMDGIIVIKVMIRFVAKFNLL